MSKFPSLIAAVALAFAGASAYAADDAAKVAKKTADDTYKMDKKACKDMKGEEHKTCMKQAKEKHDQAKRDAKAMKNGKSASTGTSSGRDQKPSSTSGPSQDGQKK